MEVLIVLAVVGGIVLYGMFSGVATGSNTKPPTQRQLQFIEKLREERDASHYDDWEPEDIEDASNLIEALLECDKHY